MNDVSTMQRRNSSTLRYVLFIAIGGMFIYGIYLYSSVQTKARNFEEKAEKYRQQYDSASAQLQGIPKCCFILCIELVFSAAFSLH